MYIDDVSLLKILPEPLLKDSQLKALVQTLDIELQKLSAQARLVLHLPRLDDLPHEVLDQLANQYHVDFYSPTTMDEITKRKLIRNSILDHRIKGTKAAVENLLNKITRGAEVTEWYEYGGKPFFFKVNLQGLLDYGDDGEIFMQMINATKNERSWLDAIDFDINIENPNFPLYLALIEVLRGIIRLDLNTQKIFNVPLNYRHSQIFSGINTFQLNKNIPTFKLNLRAGFININHGRINFAVDLQLPNDDTIEDFERYLRWRWSEFNKNPVIHWYRDDEGVIIDPEDEEFFPFDKDFLRLYFHFRDSKALRYLTLLNPRDDITAKDINALNLNPSLLIYRKHFISDKIIRAAYVKKHTLKLI